MKTTVHFLSTSSLNSCYNEIYFKQTLWWKLKLTFSWRLVFVYLYICIFVHLYTCIFVCLYIFRKSFHKFQVSFKSDRNKGTLYKDRYTFLIISSQFFLELGMFQKNILEKIKTHIFCSVAFFFENPAVYEIRWKKNNFVEPDRLWMAIWRMRIACWILKATSTHSGYVILIAFPLQQWLHGKILNVTSCVHCLSCYRLFGFVEGSKWEQFESGSMWS